MSPSITRIRFNAVKTALKAICKYYTSKKYPPEWNLAFHIQFAIIQQLLASTKNWTIEDFQEMTTKPLTPPKGMWAIPVSISTSNSEKQFIEAEVRKVIAKLGPGIDRLDVNVANISGEWQGVKQVPDEKSEKWSIAEQYAELYQDTKEGPVILYLHGGAYIVASPDTHRGMTLQLAKGCGGRVFSLRYRLAPQHPFPAALVDAVLAYKYLIYPPEGALHRPIDPTNIVIAGDSAGGGLAFALILFLIHAAPTFPLPAGIIGTSPWLDLTLSFPSVGSDRCLDYLPNLRDKLLSMKPSKAWPPPEPRYDFYSDTPLHPLVSPVLEAGDLSSCPPVFIIVGDNEYLRDESLYFASKFAKNGGRVRLQNYIGMPHVFQIFQKHPSTHTSFREYAKFIIEVTSGKTIETQMSIVNGKGVIEEQPLNLEQYPISYTKDELLKRMEAEVARRHVLNRTNSENGHN